MFFRSAPVPRVSGTYHFQWRSAAPHNTEHNDSFIRMTGPSLEIKSGGGSPCNTGDWLKVFNNAGGVAAGETVGCGVVAGSRIRRVIVAPECQGRGLGGRLMEILESKALVNHLPLAHLHASLPAKAFYDRRGYLTLCEKSVGLDSGDSLDYFLMAKPLRSLGAPSVSLDGRRFRVVRNDGPGAEVGPRTRFAFRQTGAIVSGEYRGGDIAEGELVGWIEGRTLRFHYEQVNERGEKNSGNARDVIETTPDGALRLIDRWQWESRSGRGECILEETL
jgi:GNAT superfamily N-acetyltransferase